MVISNTSQIGKFSEIRRMNEKKQVKKAGAIIRQGDIIKFGRVPVMIKESSIDKQKWDEIGETQGHQIPTPFEQ